MHRMERGKNAENEKTEKKRSNSKKQVMKKMPRLLSVGRSAKTQKMKHLQTMPGMLQMQHYEKNKECKEC